MEPRRCLKWGTRMTSPHQAAQSDMCANHNPFHSNEAMPLVAQRLLAELLCEVIATHQQNPLHVEVAGAFQAYRGWCSNVEVQTGASEGRMGGNAFDERAENWDMWRNPAVSDACAEYEHERARIQHAAPVVSALLELYGADGGLAGPKARLRAAVQHWSETR